MKDRLVVILWGAPVVALTLGAVALAPTLALPPDWLADRLRLSAGCAAAIAAWLVFALLYVSVHRLTHAADAPGPALSQASPALRLKLTFLQNTLEQTVLAAIAYLAFAANAPAADLALLPLSAGLFWLGRLCFLFGHRYGCAGAPSATPSPSCRL